MPWPIWPTETSGSGNTIAGADWNLARQFNTQWVDKALTTNAISISGDGKYRVTYSGVGTLNTITETGGDAAYIVILRADTTGAGNVLQIANGAGNIFCNQSQPITLSTDNEWALFIQIGSSWYGGKMFQL